MVSPWSRTLRGHEARLLKDLVNHKPCIGIRFELEILLAGKFASAESR